LRRAIANFLEDERSGIHAEMAHLAEQSPFRKGDETD
jgi:predicted N-acyltransferase